MKCWEIRRECGLLQEPPDGSAIIVVAYLNNVATLILLKAPFEKYQRGRDHVL